MITAAAAVSRPGSVAHQLVGFLVRHSGSPSVRAKVKISDIPILLPSGRMRQMRDLLQEAPTLVLWFLEVIAMKATQGDRITIRGKTVESSDRHGQIIEVHGADGAPPYVVRFDDGHETTVIPGGDFIVDRIQPPH